MHDFKNFKFLQREMVPIKERVNEVRVAYANVARSFSDEAPSVAPNVDKMIELYNQLAGDLEEKERELLTLTYQKNFAKLSKEYVEWVDEKLRRLQQNPTQEIAFADASKILIEELESEVAHKNDDFNEIVNMGESLNEDGTNEAVAKELENVKNVTTQLKNYLNEQRDFINRVGLYKVFCQEARAIESHISSCNRLLPNFESHLNDEELDDMTKRQTLLAGRKESILTIYSLTLSYKNYNSAVIAALN